MKRCDGRVQREILLLRLEKVQTEVKKRYEKKGKSDCVSPDGMRCAEELRGEFSSAQSQDRILGGSSFVRVAWISKGCPEYRRGSPFNGFFGPGSLSRYRQHFFKHPIIWDSSQGRFCSCHTGKSPSKDLPKKGWMHATMYRSGNESTMAIFSNIIARFLSKTFTCSGVFSTANNVFVREIVKKVHTLCICHRRQR